MDDVIGEVDHRSGVDVGGRPIYSAVGVIGAAFFLAFVCYGSADGLQTAAANDGGELSTWWVAVLICVTSAASSVLVAPAFVSRLSANTALCVAWAAHALYAMASLYPTAWTLLPTALVVGVTFPVIVVAQGVYTTALTDRWCGRPGGDAAEGEEDVRLADVGSRRRSPSMERCGCVPRATDDSLRRQNVFVFFNSILMVCLHITKL